MERNIYLDNLKAILIFFVVLGHFSHINREIPVFGVLNNIIYSFHMPLFIFVSGYFSKKIHLQRKEEITQILYTYIVFEILNLIFIKYTFFTEFSSIGCFSNNLFIPSCQNWYILGIFFWRLFIPYFNHFHWRTAFTAIAIFALVIGFEKHFAQFLGLYRIVYFMPFFVLGYYCEDINNLMEKYSRYRFLFFSILFAAFILITIVTLINRDYNFAIGYAYTPYSGYLSSANNEIMLKACSRIIGFVSSIAICFCFLFVIPTKKTFYSIYGMRTLNIYLLHMFFVWPVAWLFQELNINIALMALISLIMSIALTIFLSSNFINKVMAPLTNGTKIFALFGRPAS